MDGGVYGGIAQKLHASNFCQLNLTKRKRSLNLNQDHNIMNMKSKFKLK